MGRIAYETSSAFRRAKADADVEKTSGLEIHLPGKTTLSRGSMSLFYATSPIDARFHNIKEKFMEEKPEFSKKLDPPITQIDPTVVDLQVTSNTPSQGINPDHPTGIHVFQEHTEASLSESSCSSEPASLNNKGFDELSSPEWSGGLNPSDTNTSLFSSKDVGSATTPSTNMEVSGYESLSQPLVPFQTVDIAPASPMDAASAALMRELGQTTGVEDLSDQFEHTHRKGVARGGYSEVFVTHLRDHTTSSLVQVGFSIPFRTTLAH